MSPSPMYESKIYISIYKANVCVKVFQKSCAVKKTFCTPTASTWLKFDFCMLDVRRNNICSVQTQRERRLFTVKPDVEVHVLHTCSISANRNHNRPVNKLPTLTKMAFNEAVPQGQPLLCWHSWDFIVVFF